MPFLGFMIRLLHEFELKILFEKRGRPQVQSAKFGVRFSRWAVIASLRSSESSIAAFQVATKLSPSTIEWSLLKLFITSLRPRVVSGD